MASGNGGWSDTDSATENIPSRAAARRRRLPQSSRDKGEKVRSREGLNVRAHRPGGDTRGQGKPHTEQDQIGGEERLAPQSHVVFTDDEGGYLRVGR